MFYEIIALRIIVTVRHQMGSEKMSCFSDRRDISQVLYILNEVVNLAQTEVRGRIFAEM